MNRIPVHIVTGFLGAGKTTFLNHFIGERLPERIVVVENEFGATNVDGALVMNGVKDVVELTAGCLCCDLSDGLLDVLRELYQRRDEFDRLVIETTGIADPSSIMQVFLENPSVEKVYDLQQVISLVDAGNIEDWLNETEEALRQIAVADVLLLNKTDRVSEDQQEEVLSLLFGINPQARVFKGMNGVFPVDKIMEAGTVKPESIEIIGQMPDHFHQHDTVSENRHKITTFTIAFPHPLDLNHLQVELNRIVHLYREQVYRVKGFIAIPGYPNRVILQSARSAFIVTDGSPWETEHDRVGKLVFIGRNLNKPAFERMFKRHMVTPAD